MIFLTEKLWIAASILHNRQVKEENGTVMMEALIAFPLFLFLLIVSLDLLKVSYHALGFQYAVQELSREVAIGSIRPADVDSEIITRAQEFAIPAMGRTTTNLCLIENYPDNCAGIANVGTGDIFVMTVDYRVSSFTMSALSMLSSRVFTISSQAIGRVDAG